MIDYRKLVSKVDLRNINIFYTGVGIVFFFLTFNKWYSGNFESSDLYVIPLVFLCIVCGEFERLVYELRKSHNKDIIDYANDEMSSTEYNKKWLILENSKDYSKIKNFFETGSGLGQYFMPFYSKNVDNVLFDIKDGSVSISLYEFCDGKDGLERLSDFIIMLKLNHGFGFTSIRCKDEFITLKIN